MSVWRIRLRSVSILSLIHICKSKVSIDAIHISDIAGATYLIPHKREPLFMSFDDESLYWINWLDVYKRQIPVYPVGYLRSEVL